MDTPSTSSVQHSIHEESDAEIFESDNETADKTVTNRCVALNGIDSDTDMTMSDDENNAECVEVPVDDLSSDTDTADEGATVYLFSD